VSIHFDYAYRPDYPPREADPWVWVRALTASQPEPGTGRCSYEEPPPRDCWLPPSLHWMGFRLRPLTFEELADCVAWVRPADAPPIDDNERLWWTTGVSSFQVNCEIAARLREFLELHPELPARARLDLLRFFPSFPADIERAWRALAEVDLNASLRDADSDGVGGLGDDLGHDELSVGGVTAPTGRRPGDRGKSAVAGDDAARAEAAA
jgi:hypothetical protein